MCVSLQSLIRWILLISLFPLKDAVSFHRDHYVHRSSLVIGVSALYDISCSVLTWKWSKQLSVVPEVQRVWLMQLPVWRWWGLKLLKPEQPVQTPTFIMRRSTRKLKIYSAIPLLSTPFWACYRNNQRRLHLKKEKPLLSLSTDPAFITSWNIFASFLSVSSFPSQRRWSGLCSQFCLP